MKAEHTKDESDYLKAVGQRIREARQNLGQSQETFARTCNLDRTYISDVERGERNISLLNLKKLADTLGIPLSTIVD
jgi:transcriptional regulator with XRE-family HTH domain